MGIDQQNNRQDTATADTAIGAVDRGGQKMGTPSEVGAMHSLFLPPGINDAALWIDKKCRELANWVERRHRALEEAILSRNSPEDPNLLNSRQAGELAGMDPRRFWRICAGGRGPKATKINGIYVYHKAEVEAWITKRANASN